MLLHYRVRQILGRGRSGEALLAHDERLHRDVVLKRLVSGDRDRRLVEREARILAQLSHPNVAGVHAVETADDDTFLVLEFVDGHTLEQVLGTGPLPAPALVALAHTLCSALAHAHARGVLHGDLKPDNILIAHDGTVKLADFGVAHLQGGPTEAWESSSLYQSPEQSVGDPTDSRSDLYSLALVLAECATGSRVAAVPGVPPSPEALRSIGAQLPAALAAPVTRCLASRPEARPESAHSILEALEAAARPRPRRAAIQWAASVAALLLAAMAMALRFEWWPIRAPADPMTLVIVASSPPRSEGLTRVLTDAFANAVHSHLSQVSAIRLVELPPRTAASTQDLARDAVSARARGAGRLLIVDLERRGTRVRAQLTLVDTRSLRVVWADARDLDDGTLPRGVATAAQEVARALGAPVAHRYEWFLHAFSDSLMSDDPSARAALEEARGGDIDRTFRTARAFLTAHPNSVDAHVLMAYAQLSMNWALGPLDRPGRAAFESAIDSLRAIDPRSPWDEVMRALMLSRDGELDAAVSAFSSVLANPSLGPSGRAMTLGFRGQALRDRGEGQAALRDLREAVALDGTNTVTLVILADALGTFGHAREGLEVAQRSVAIAPSRAHTHTAAAQAHVRLGQWREAEICIREAHRLVPSMDTHALLALTLLKEGREEDAERERAGAEREIETVWGRSTLARYHAARGDQDAAFRELSRSVSLGFADPEVERITDFDTLRSQPRFATLWPRRRRPS